MKKKFTKYILPIALILCILGSSFKTQDNSDLFEITKNLEIFTSIYKELNAHYVEEIDPSHLMKIGIDAMMHSLDPYTVYYSENEIQRSKYITEGNYDGIGVQMEFVDDYMTISGLYEGYSADRNNLDVGDQIIAVNGKSTMGMRSDEFSSLMKGSKGKTVQLKIYRPVENREFEIEIPRESVVVPNVPYSGMVSEHVGYIVLTVFTPKAAANIKKAINELKASNPGLNSLILDLRGNGGGLLREAVRICNLFIPEGKVVVSTKGKVKELDNVYRTSSQPLDPNIPLVVLVNNNSASASEIVSGTLQDYDRAVIMGQRTYGKGLVQRTKKVGYNSGIKLTVAKYYIPSGRCIQSVEYDENGNPIDIPDSLRSVFKTMNERTVLDGGGIKPDVVLDKRNISPLIKELQDQHIIMKFVSHYLYGKTETPDKDGIVFQDYDTFLNYIESHDFDYSTKSEKTLDKLEKHLKAETYYSELEDEFEKIHLQMKKAKANSFSRYKEEIIDMIEEEIMTRYYYQKGRYVQKLRNDEEIQAAIDLLKNEKRYHDILNPPM